MNKTGIALAQLVGELPNGFKEGQGFNVPGCTTDFNNGDVRSSLGTLLDGFLDLVGDVRNHLNCFAQIFSPVLFE